MAKFGKATVFGAVIVGSNPATAIRRRTDQQLRFRTDRCCELSGSRRINPQS